MSREEPTNLDQKPTIDINWDMPKREQETLGNLNWGTYRPQHLPFTPAMAPDHEPNHGEVMSTLSELMNLVRMEYGGFSALNSPDMGIEQGSYHRPDLFPAIKMALECMRGIRQELRYGPKRTMLDPETGEWKVVIPNMDVQTEARKAGKIRSVV